MIYKGQLTDEVVDHLTAELATANVLVGDAVAPEPGGWTGGQPGIGTFKAYVVLGGGTGTKHFQDAVGASDSSWFVSYTLRGVGASRQQADFALDRARGAFKKLRRAQLQIPDVWSIVKVDYTQLGPPQPNNATNPPFWEAVDGVSLWLEAGRS